MWILTGKEINYSDYKLVSLNFAAIDDSGNKNTPFPDKHYQ